MEPKYEEVHIRQGNKLITARKIKLAASRCSSRTLKLLTASLITLLILGSVVGWLAYEKRCKLFGASCTRDENATVKKHWQRENGTRPITSEGAIKLSTETLQRTTTTAGGETASSGSTGTIRAKISAAEKLVTTESHQDILTRPRATKLSTETLQRITTTAGGKTASGGSTGTTWAKISATEKLSSRISMTVASTESPEQFSAVFSVSTECYFPGKIIYIGKANRTTSGADCKRWTEAPSMAAHQEYFPGDNGSVTEAENFCRSPASHNLTSPTNMPWCYPISLGGKNWERHVAQEPCNVPQCVFDGTAYRAPSFLTSTDCYYPERIRYVGNLTHTKSGSPCKQWHQSRQFAAGETAEYYGRYFPDATGHWDNNSTYRAENFCRSPLLTFHGQTLAPWCFTLNGEQEGREYCGVPLCNVTTNSFL